MDKILVLFTVSSILLSTIEAACGVFTQKSEAWKMSRPTLCAKLGMTVIQILSAPTGRCGYAVMRKWWKRRMSAIDFGYQIWSHIVGYLADTYKHPRRGSQVARLLWMLRDGRPLC